MEAIEKEEKPNQVAKFKKNKTKQIDIYMTNVITRQITLPMSKV